MIYRLLYNLLIHLGLPLALLALYKPKKGKPGFGKRWAEHLGRAPATGQEAPLWIHAVSVGETLAISPFIRALKAEQPSLPILLTTTTRTGAEQAAKLGDLVVHRYAPLDYPWAVSAFLATFKPRALWVMETELWPNWLAACEAHHLPVTILNARLSRAILPALCPLPGRLRCPQPSADPPAVPAPGRRGSLPSSGHRPRAAGSDRLHQVRHPVWRRGAGPGPAPCASSLDRGGRSGSPPAPIRGRTSRCWPPSIGCSGAPIGPAASWCRAIPSALPGWPSCAPLTAACCALTARVRARR